MNTSSSKKTRVQTFVSVGLLGLFLLLATGSSEELFILGLLDLDLESVQKYDPEKENYEHNYKWNKYYQAKHAPRHRHGYREGKFNFLTGYINRVTGDTIFGNENGFMLEGLRYGPCVTTYHYGRNFEFNGEKTVYYIAGHPVTKSDFDYYMEGGDIHWLDFKKSETVSSDFTAWQYLSERYPWFVLQIHSSGYDSTYQESYLDTLETILQANTFGADEFDDYYDMAMDELTYTPYDSLAELNSLFSYLQGLDDVLGNELRLAVLDRYYVQEGNTFDIVAKAYPGYLASMVGEAEVPEADFELFCEKLDSAMNSYGMLNLADPFFVDSVDARIYRALFAIMESGENPDLKSAAAQHGPGSGFPVTIRDLIKVLSRETGMKSTDFTPPEVAEIVLYTIVMAFFEGDLIKESVHVSWLAQNGITSPAEAKTSFYSHNSATSVTLVGYVSAADGTEVSERGIAWATHYNPGTGDWTETAGTGTGFYHVDLTGLTTGERYYARAYATNPAGTAYGNCIEFTALNTVGLETPEPDRATIRIYPNPAASSARLRIPPAVSGNCRVQITDLDGRVHLELNVDPIGQEEKEINLDLRGLIDGSYICRLQSESGQTCAARLLICK